MEYILEVLKTFILLELNAEKSYNYLLSEKNITLSKPLIYSIYKEIRKVIYQYYRIVYETESLGVINGNQYYSVDESLFIHRDKEQLWLLGAIDNSSKDFRLEASIRRDSQTLEKFIKKYLEKGNTVITDGWLGYSFLDNGDSCYQHIKHLHGGGDFGTGLESTSHIEGLWGILKSKIKSTYMVIPNVNFMKFLRESEFKYKNRSLNNEGKIAAFFEAFRMVYNTGEKNFHNNDFYSDSEDLDNDSVE